MFPHIGAYSFVAVGVLPEILRHYDPPAVSCPESHCLVRPVGFFCIRVVKHHDYIVLILGHQLLTAVFAYVLACRPCMQIIFGEYVIGCDDRIGLAIVCFCGCGVQTVHIVPDACMGCVIPYYFHTQVAYPVKAFLRGGVCPADRCVYCCCTAACDNCRCNDRSQ